MSNIDFSELIISKKNVLSSERQNIGNIIGEKDDSILVEDPGVNDNVLIIPKSKIETYNGAQIILSIPESEIEPYAGKREMEEVATVHLLEESLDILKRTKQDNVTITKEPLTETKSVEVALTHEELTIERRKPEVGQTETSLTPVTSRTEIQIPIKREEVQVTKSPYIKDEIVIKKKPVTKIKKIMEEVTTEKVTVSSDEI